MPDKLADELATANTEAWACDGCGMGWAVSLINRYLLPRPGDHAEQIGAARWLLGQVVALADEMPKLSDVELRDHLLTLANRTLESLPGQPMKS